MTQIDDKMHLNTHKPGQLLEFGDAWDFRESWSVDVRDVAGDFDAYFLPARWSPKDGTMGDEHWRVWSAGTGEYVDRLMTGESFPQVRRFPGLDEVCDYIDRFCRLDPGTARARAKIKEAV